MSTKVPTMASLSVATPSPPSAPAANIRVYVRVRPQNAREKENGGVANVQGHACLTADTKRRMIEVASGSSAPSKTEVKQFAYDHVADETATQEDVFLKVGKPITDSCLAGYNGTIFAYGQTGSGKTYTLQNANDSSAEGRGLMPRVFEYLMSSIAKDERKPLVQGQSRIAYTITASYAEIYMEKIYDLLLDAGSASSGSLQLREDSLTKAGRQRGVYVEGLSEELVSSARECEEVMKRGAVNRRIGETALNRESSRSHSVFTLTIKSTQTVSGRTVEKNARFNLIDLAGSERAKDTGAKGERMNEAKNINRSLSALGNVIRELVKKSSASTSSTDDDTHVASHVPYRDSRLTFLLRDSLGGNSLTYLVACVSSAPGCFFESLSTLKFARMASAVKNCAKVNEDASASLEALKEENERLKESMARLLAQQQVGARRLSMMPGSNGGFNPRESLCAPGLITPSRLRSGNSFFNHKTPTHSMLATIPSTPSSISATPSTSTGADPSAFPYYELFHQSHAREQSWLSELEVYKQQVDILEQKQRLDGWKMKMQEMQLKEAKSRMNGTIDESTTTDASLLAENERVKEELSLLQQYAPLVTHAPSLIAAQRKIQVLKDRLEKAGLGIDIPAGTTEEPSFLKSFSLQSLLTKAQNDLAECRETLEEADMKMEDALQTQSEAFATERIKLEQACKSESEMVTHMESQLVHLQSQMSQERREQQEQLLLKHAVLLRAENERDSLAQQIRALELSRSAELESLARSSAEETSAVADKLLQQIQTQQSTMEAQSKEIKTLSDRVFEKDQELLVLRKNLSDIHEDLSKEKARAAGIEKELKQTKETSQDRITDLEAQLNELSNSLSCAQIEATEMQSTVSSLQSSLTSESALLAQARNECDKVTFALESLQEDHDTLSAQFEFLDGLLEELKGKLGESERHGTEKDAAINSLNGTIVAQESQIFTLKQSLAEAQSNLSFEVAFENVRREQELLEAKYEEVQAELKESMKSLATAEHDLSIAAASRVEMQSTLQAQESSIFELREMIQSMHAKLSEAQSDSIELGKENESLSQQLDESRSALEDSRSQIAECDSKNEELLQQLVSKDSYIGELRGSLAHTHESLEEAHRTISGLERSLEVSNGRITELDGQLAASNEEFSSLQSAHTTLTQEKAAVESKLASIVSLAAELGNSAQEHQQKQQQEQSDRAREIDVLNKQLQSAQSDASHARAQFHALQSTLEKLEGLSKQREGDLISVQGTLKQVHEKLMVAIQERDAANLQIATLQSKIQSLQHDVSQARDEAELASKDSSVLLALQAELTQTQELLQASLCERDGWVKEMEACRGEEAAAVDALASARVKLDELQDQLAKITDSNLTLQKEHSVQSEQLASLIGHQNSKQKIQLHQQIKRENDLLRQEKQLLEREIKKFRKLVSTGGMSAGSTVSSKDPPSLELALQQADDHIRQGEQAQIQLKTLCERIVALETKVRGAALTEQPLPTAVLGDITNTPSTGESASLPPLKQPSAVVDASFPACLSSLSSVSATFNRIVSQLDQSRREATTMRKIAKLQQMKESLAVQKQAVTMDNGNTMRTEESDTWEERENRK